MGTERIIQNTNTHKIITLQFDISHYRPHHKSTIYPQAIFPGRLRLLPSVGRVWTWRGGLGTRRAPQMNCCPEPVKDANGKEVIILNLHR